jgi:RHS repeat-associated protein
MSFSLRRVSSFLGVGVTASLLLTVAPALGAQSAQSPQPPENSSTVPGSPQGAPPAEAPVSPGPVAESRPGEPVVSARPGEEIAQLRTRTSRTYAEAGGVQRTVFAAEAQNYLDDAGRWQPIDSTLVAADAPGYARRNAANRYRVDLPADLSDAPVRMTTGEAWVAFALRGASAPAAFEGAAATYAEALPDVDVSYHAEPDGIKELLTLRSPKAQNSFEFDLATAPGLDVVAQDSGELVITDADGTVVMTVPAPFMTDAAGITSFQVRYALQREGAGWLLTVTADRAWLDAPDRVWPVVVDPALYTSHGGGSPTCTIASATPTVSGGCTEMRVGKDSSGAEQRGLLSFDMSRFYPKAAVILDAELQLGLLSATTTNVASVNVAALTKPYTAQATWNTTNGTTAWTSPGGDSVPAGTTAVSTTGTPDALRWYPTEQVQKWVDGTTAEHGFLLQSTGTNVLTFGGSGASYPNYPVLTVRYDPSSGDRPRYSMDRHPLTDRTTLAINRASGNAHVSVNHLQLDGPGLDLQLGHVYNAGTWELSPARLLRRPSGSIDFTAPDGSVVPFLPNGSGTLKTPPGVNADLAAAGPDAYTLTFRQSGEVWTFAKKQTFSHNQDVAFHRTKTADKNGNAITYAYVDMTDGPLLSSVTDTAGRVTTFSSSRVDYKDRYDSITDPLQRVTTFGYNSCSGCLSSITNADNKTTSFGYDADAQLVKITDPLGNQTNITYDARFFFDRVSAVTRVTDTTAQTGPTTRYHYPANRLTENQASLETSTTGWSARKGTIARSTAQAREGAASLAATSNGSLWVTTATGTAAVPAEPDRTYTGRFSVRAASNSANVYAGLTFYDTNGATLPNNIWGEPLLDSSSAWKDGVWVRGKAPAGTKYVSLEAYFSSTVSGDVHYLDRASVAVDRAYFSSSDSVQWNPGLPYALPAGCAGQDATRQVSPNGGSTTYCFDSTGRVASVTNPLGHNRATTYSPNDDIATASDAMGVGNIAGNTTSYSYDSDFRPTGSTAPTGAASTLSYAEPTGPVTNRAAHYQPSGSTDADGSTSSFSYDGPGNLKSASTSTPTGAVSSTYTYNGPAGTAPTCGGKPGQVCTVTDGNGNTTSYSYDSLGQRQKVTPPAPLGPTTYTYDGVGRVSSKTDGKNQTTRYSYDALDRVTFVQVEGATSCTSTDISGGKCVKYSYDATGNRTSMTDQSGTSSYGYDKLGRETSRNLPSTGTTSLTYDANSNTLTATDASGTITYGYDAANQLKTLAEPGTSCPTDGSAAAGCTRFGYDPNGVRIETRYPTSTATVMTVQPDNSGRTARVFADTGSTQHYDLSYTYSRQVNGVATDGALKRTRTDNLATGSTGKTTTYDYNTLSELTSAVEVSADGASSRSWTYAYDNAGNRTSATLGTTQNSFGYNAANQLISRNGSTSGFSYDANGNETAAVGSTTRTNETWNAKQQLTNVTVGSTSYPMSYADLGNGLRLSAAGTNFRNTALGVTAQTTSGGTTTSFVRDPDGKLIAMRSGTSSYYYLFDALGSVIGLVDSAGTKVNSYKYDPYGWFLENKQGISQPYRYAGGYYDLSTGLYKFGIRYYDRMLGRFTQLDPTGQDPHYTYARNNPVNFVDRTGAVSVDCGIITCTAYFSSDETVDIIAAAAFGAGPAIAATPAIIALSAAFPAVGVAAVVGAVLAVYVASEAIIAAAQSRCLKVRFGLYLEAGNYGC